MEKKIEIILNMDEVLHFLERKYNGEYEKVLPQYPYYEGIVERFQAAYQSDGTFKLAIVQTKVTHKIGS